MMRGTPYIYMGEEIGMTDPCYQSIEDYKDIESHNAYKMLIEKGLSENGAFKIISKKSRDNSRTPMQWDDSTNAGFSNETPWLGVNNNYKNINVAKALENQNSVYYYYKKLIRLRKNGELISDGSYKPILKDHPSIFAYMREYENQKLINFNNFYGKEVELSLGEILTDIKDYEYLLGNYGQVEIEEKIKLRPYESVAFIKR